MNLFYHVQIVLLAGSAYIDFFRYTASPLYKQVWTERIKPYHKDYPSVRAHIRLERSIGH